MKPIRIYTYNAIDILLASPTEPTPIEKRTHQLSRAALFNTGDQR